MYFLSSHQTLICNVGLGRQWHHVSGRHIFIIFIKDTFTTWMLYLWAFVRDFAIIVIGAATFGRKSVRVLSALIVLRGLPPVVLNKISVRDHRGMVQSFDYAGSQGVSEQLHDPKNTSKISQVVERAISLPLVRVLDFSSAQIDRH